MSAPNANQDSLEQQKNVEMKTMYHSDAVTIYQGEILQALQTFSDGEFDAVITDPPYSSGGTAIYQRQRDPFAKYHISSQKNYPPLLGDGKDQRSFYSWATFWLYECWRVTKLGGPLLVFTDWRQLPIMTDALQAAGWYWMGIVAWDKGNTRPMPGRFRHAEFILFASKGRFAKTTDKCFPGVMHHPLLASKKHHLTGKPVPLLSELMQITANGSRILDPFIGSGTTALAALETGRRCVGIDLSCEYAAIAAKRVRETEATES